VLESHATQGRTVRSTSDGQGFRSTEEPDNRESREGGLSSRANWSSEMMLHRSRVAPLVRTESPSSRWSVEPSIRLDHGCKLVWRGPMEDYPVGAEHQFLTDSLGAAFRGAGG